MSETLVSMKNAARTYFRGKVAVPAVLSATCSVLPGGRIALVGPSGSGKSTLLQVMGGLDTLTSGSVSWPALGSSESLRPNKVGFVFQARSLLDPLTVVENVELPLLFGDGSAAEARRTAIDVLDRLDLKALAGKLPEELSGGQAQRVAVARSLACRPKLILADEPTGQLDHPTAQRLLDALLACLEGTDTALVIATHDCAVADRMCATWRMEHGILEVN